MDEYVNKIRDLEQIATKMREIAKSWYLDAMEYVEVVNVIIKLETEIGRQKIVGKLRREKQEAKTIR